jgi:hypothetical protein
MNQRRQSLVLMQRVPSLNLFNEPRLATVKSRLQSPAFVQIEVNSLAQTHQPVKNRPKIAQPLHTRDSGDLPRFLLRQLLSFPDFHLRRRLPDKQPVFVAVRIQHQNRLLLRDAGQIKKLGILPQ